MLTREIPFKGLEGLQVAWLVVEKNEVKGVSIGRVTDLVSAAVLIVVYDVSCVFCRG